jgi:hypothetical protein
MKLSLFLLSTAAMVNATTATAPATATGAIATSGDEHAPVRRELAHGSPASNPVLLRSACNYVILAKSGISTVPNSVITGNIAVSPIAATAITGFGLTLDSEGQFSTASQVVTGKAYGASYGGATATVLTAAVSDMETAYLDAASRPNADASRINIGDGTGDISGWTLTPGVYTFTTGVKINSAITIDAQGHPDAVFIIQTTGVLSLATNTHVILSGGALAKNIVWQVAGNAVFGVGSVMKGILLVKTDVAFNTGSSLDGRIFAQTAATLQMATITQDDGTCVPEPSLRP